MLHDIDRIRERATNVGRLFDLVEGYRDGFVPHRPSYRQVSDILGMSPQGLLNWRQPMTELPKRKHLEALAALTGEPLWKVVQAALTDARLPFQPPAAGNRDSA